MPKSCITYQKVGSTILSTTITTTMIPMRAPIAVLQSLQIRSAVYCRVELHGHWALHFAATHCASFHVIEHGSAWICVEGHEPLALKSGDFVVITQGAAHDITTDRCLPSLATIYLGDDQNHEYRCEAYGEGDNPTALTCGTFDLDRHDHQKLFGLMPPVLLVRSIEDEWLAPTLRMFAAEARNPQPGSQTMLRRLADMVLIQVVRYWLATATHPAHGWVGALRDPQIAQAIGLIHQEGAQHWTVQELAQMVGMSRSAFSARFSELVGEAPMSYLVGWRMQTAERLLTTERLQLIDVAERVGYTSEAAFSKAFKRERGMSPSSYRRLARDG
jgi:AraC-like DNA-binding protein/mannose-6-phosphate isomerase-like protein (cupin superfamily)